MTVFRCKKIIDGERCTGSVPFDDPVAQPGKQSSALCDKCLTPYTLLRTPDGYEMVETERA